MVLVVPDKIKKRQDKLNAALLGEDELGVVVRGHIVIEQELIEFIEMNLVNKSYLNAMSLDYSQRVKLAMALGLSQEKGPALQAIGKLRNAFAHNIEKGISDEDAKNIYKSLGEEAMIVTNRAYEKMPEKSSNYVGKTFKQLEPKDRVILCIITIWAGVAGEVASATNIAD